MSIYSRIKTLCELNEITINKLEKETGITRGSIARWDKNSPSISKVIPVADFFGISIDFLVLGKKKSTSLKFDGLSSSERDLIKLFNLVPPKKRQNCIELLRNSLKIAGVL